MWRLLFLIFIPLLAATPVVAEKRVALIIGNNAYQHVSPLANPRNDANDMATALRQLNFDVILALDVTRAKMFDVLKKFRTKLEGADLGLFFYAGHGLQVAGLNYLIPIEAQLSDELSVDLHMIPLQRVQSIMESMTKTNIIFLDACRDNPLVQKLRGVIGTRSTEVKLGLAPVKIGSGTLISFSTEPGNVALDGKDRNSPFTNALKTRIVSKNKNLSAVLIDVRNDVIAATRGKQTPWEHSSLRQEVYLNPSKQSSEALHEPPPVHSKSPNPTLKRPEFLDFVRTGARLDPTRLQVSSPISFRVNGSVEFDIFASNEQPVYCWYINPEKTAYILTPNPHQHNDLERSSHKTRRFPQDFGFEAQTFEKKSHDMFGCFLPPTDISHTAVHKLWIKLWGTGGSGSKGALNEIQVREVLSSMRRIPGMLEAYTDIIIED